MFIEKRNQRGDDRLYLGTTNPGYADLMAIYKKKKSKRNEPIEITIEGVSGMVLAADENVAIGG